MQSFPNCFPQISAVFHFLTTLEFRSSYKMSSPIYEDGDTYARDWVRPIISVEISDHQSSRPLRESDFLPPRLGSSCRRRRISLHDTVDSDLLDPDIGWSDRNDADEFDFSDSEFWGTGNDIDESALSESEFSRDLDRRFDIEGLVLREELNRRRASRRNYIGGPDFLLPPQQRRRGTGRPHSHSFDLPTRNHLQTPMFETYVQVRRSPQESVDSQLDCSREIQLVRKTYQTSLDKLTKVATICRKKTEQSDAGLRDISILLRNRMEEDARRTEAVQPDNSDFTFTRLASLVDDHLVKLRAWSLNAKLNEMQVENSKDKAVIDSVSKMLKRLESTTTKLCELCSKASPSDLAITEIDMNSDVENRDSTRIADPEEFV